VARSTPLSGELYTEVGFVGEDRGEVVRRRDGEHSGRGEDGHSGGTEGRGARGASSRSFTNAWSMFFASTLWDEIHGHYNETVSFRDFFYTLLSENETSVCLLPNRQTEPSPLPS
jgi:hypothetical protein